MQGLSEHERYKPYNARTIRDTCLLYTSDAADE